MQKKTISFSIIALGVAIFVLQSFPAGAYTTQLPYQQLANYAIQLTKQATPTYGTYTLPATTTTVATNVYLPDSDILVTENSFKTAIDNARSTGYPTNGYNGFLNNLANRNQTQLNTVNNGQLDIYTRGRAMLSNDFYKNYISLWNNPKFNTGNMAGTWANTCTTANCTTVNTNLTYSPMSTYTTASQKTYYLWSSQDARYRFSALNNINDIRKYGFRDLPTLYNYLEYQNRILYVAPNSRRYGIFKYNTAYRFNRDEGSVSDNEWVTIADVKAYIDQHNQPVTGCTVVKEWHCIQ